MLDHARSRVVVAASVVGFTFLSCVQSPYVSQWSHARLGLPTAPPPPPAAAPPLPRLEFYKAFVDSFVGGYTVAGTSLTQGGASGSSNFSEFSVAQECLCEVRATAHGIFARGANEANAFSFIVAKESDGQWRAQQVSIGVTPAYQATMYFGETAGAEHSAVGFYLNPAEGGEQTAFRAEQSAVGCYQGIGAQACEHVCGAQGLSWLQIKSKCTLASPQIGLHPKLS